MKKNIAKQVEEYLAPKIDSLGYELYEVEYAKKQNGMNLTLFIESKTGDVTLKDCEKVHRVVDKLLDELNPTGDMPYYLNVSSIGLDKPLTSEKDYIRCAGKMVDIKFFVPFGVYGKSLTGVLIGHDSNNLRVEERGENISIPLKNIASCKLHIDF